MANIEEIRQKIDRLIQDNGLKYRDVSLRIGRTDSYIQQYVKYGFPKRLNELDRLKLANILRVDEAEITDDEIMQTKTADTSSETKRLLSDFVEAGSDASDPLEKIDFLSGTQKDKYSKTSESLFLNRRLLEKMTAVDPHHLKMLRILSDSMDPQVRIGDFVWVDISEKTPRSDGLYLLDSGEIPTVRQVIISPLDGSVEISASNPSYRSYTAENTAKVKTIGRIVYLLKQI
jgi:phage repressor protein C with HTH and peptisase S24 domain